MRPRTLIALFSVLALLLALPAGAEEQPERVHPDRPTPWQQAPAGVDVAPDLWFVELTSPPTAEGTAPGQIQRERAQLRRQAAAEGVRYTERRAFGALFNGLSVQADATNAGALAQLPSVRAVHPVAVVPLPDEPVTSPQLSSALAMTGADIAQSELGLTGEDVRVAIIDTGIDYEHPDLGGGFGPGHKVEVGTDFVGDDFNAQDPDTTPVPDPDPMDCNGHGTHVAGIVGALAADEDGVTGVAPGVTLGAYRVFGCEGSTTADVIIDALEAAHADGMHVVNMSIGAAYTWPQYPTAEASDRLVEEGVVVVASIGNSGASGTWSAGAPGLGSQVIGVASFDNTEIPARTFLIDPDTENEQQVPYLTMSNAPEPPTEGTTPPLVHVGRGCPVTDDTPEADPYLEDPDGAVALVQRGACTFESKYQRAADAGAVGVVIYNNVPGLFAGGGITPREGIWAAAISDTDGDMLVDLLEVRDEDLTITWTPDRVQAPNPTGGLLSSFSSYGLSPDLDLKPDIGAPGGLITSTYPLDQGGYATISGTSMSAPHVAGGVALLLESAPDTPTHRVRDVLQNTAEPAAWSLAPAAGFLDNVHRQGAGMLRIDEAILATTAVTPGKIALGASDEGIPTTTLTVTNSGDTDVTYAVGHAGALSTAGSTYTPGFYLPAGEATFSTESLTVPAGGSATLDATIAPQAVAAPNHQYGGYIVLTPDDEGAAVLRVPYAGYEGDYQELTVLDVEPELARETDDGVEPVDAEAVFRPARGDLPLVRVHFGHHASALSIRARDLASGEVIPILDAEHLARSAGADSRTTFAWDGTRRAGASEQRRPARPGRYVIEVEVLKALGDPGNPDHVETWTSAPFRIDPSNRPR